MPNYARSAATAKRLIEKAGRTIKLFRANDVPADASKPWLGADQAASPAAAAGGLTVTCKAAFVPASGSGFGRDFRDRKATISGREGSTLKDVTQLALIASESVKPAGTDLGQFDSMLDGDTILRIHSAQELKPGTVSLMWELGVGA